MVSKIFKKTAIFSSLDNLKVKKLSQQIEEILNSFGVKVILPNSSSLKNDGRKQYNNAYITKNADLVVAIGGDGTLLTAARNFGFKGLPILGVNLGSLGFLNDITPRDLTSKLRQIFSGEFISDERTFLQTTLKQKGKFISLNEVVIHSTKIAQLIEYELFIDNIFVYRQKADGLLISTPTGSTAYSLSGNGPIIAPTVKALTLMPMFAHSLNTRPLIVQDGTKIDIKISKRGRAGISFDGHDSYNLKYGDVVSIESAKETLQLLHPKDHDFYDACRTKLGWSLGVPNKET